MPGFISRCGEACARWVTRQAGSTWSLFLALFIIGAWLAAGMYYEWSTSHSLFINTITTIITFLMVFLIQRTQNKESFALQMKLNELIAAHQGCSNRLICLEDLSEEEILKLYKRYKKLAELSKVEEGWHNPHSIEEIEEVD